MSERHKKEDYESIVYYNKLLSIYVLNDMIKDGILLVFNIIMQAIYWFLSIKYHHDLGFLSKLGTVTSTLAVFLGVYSFSLNSKYALYLINVNKDKGYEEVSAGSNLKRLLKLVDGVTPYLTFISLVSLWFVLNNL